MIKSFFDRELVDVAITPMLSMVATLLASYDFMVILIKAYNRKIYVILKHNGEFGATYPGLSIVAEPAFSA